MLKAWYDEDYDNEKILNKRVERGVNLLDGTVRNRLNEMGFTQRKNKWKPALKPNRKNEVKAHWKKAIMAYGQLEESDIQRWIKDLLALSAWIVEDIDCFSPEG